MICIHDIYKWRKTRFIIIIIIIVVVVIVLTLFIFNEGNIIHFFMMYHYIYTIVMKNLI